MNPLIQFKTSNSASYFSLHAGLLWAFADGASTRYRHRHRTEAIRTSTRLRVMMRFSASRPAIANTAIGALCAL